MKRDELILSKIEAQQSAYDAILARLDPADRRIIERQVAYEAECVDEHGHVPHLIGRWLDDDESRRQEDDEWWEAIR